MFSIPRLQELDDDEWKNKQDQTRGDCEMKSVSVVFVTHIVTVLIMVLTYSFLMWPTWKYVA